MRSAALLSLALLACAAPYKPEGFNGGYGDFELPQSPGLHYVSFTGNLLTSAARGTTMWYRRAAEVCGSAGYELVTPDGKILAGQVPRVKYAGPIYYPFVEGYVRCKAASN